MVKGVKNLQQWAAVQELYKRKIPIQQIARQLKMSRNTVKKLIKLKAEPSYTRTSYPSKVDSYMNQIIQWRKEPQYDFNGTRIFRELKRIGYLGTIGPVYRALKKIDESSSAISSLATIRIETPVGDQAQFDWAHYEVIIGTRIRTVYCFTMILSASRKKAICFSLSSNGSAIYEAIQELFEDLGGVTLELIIDNPKALVLENNADSNQEVKYNSQALLVAAHLGTELNACNSYWARTKGKIEKPYQYIEEQFIKGNTFTSMTDLNIQGKAFIDNWNTQMHTTTKRIPQEYFETEERQSLQKLPLRRLNLTPLTKRIISNDSLIHINANKYSVPVEYATKVLKYRITYGFRIDIFTLSEVFLFSVEISDGKHLTIKDPEHYAPIQTRVNKSIPQIKRDFMTTFKNGKEYFDLASQYLQQPSYHARKILELLELYTVETLDLVLLYAISQNSFEIKNIKYILKEKYFELISNGQLEQSFEIQSQTSLLRNCSYYDTESEVLEI